MLFQINQTLVSQYKYLVQHPNGYIFSPWCDGLTDAVCVRHAFSRHTVAPQTLMHEVAGLAVLHPVVCGGGDHQEYVPYPCAKQSTSHKAVHLAPTKKKYSMLKWIHQSGIFLNTRLINHGFINYFLYTTVLIIFRIIFYCYVGNTLQ